jgi:adenosylcobinamide-GDP ribazoletransferase
MRATGPLAPLYGALIGSLGGAIYWLAVQIWPSSVAVILSMAATALATSQIRGGSPATRLDVTTILLSLLIKYNALMALSAAKLPFAVAPNVPLALIMICGYAASFAMLVSVMAARPEKSPSVSGPPSVSGSTSVSGSVPVSGGALALALLIGFAPASVLGIPGLIGLAAAIVAGLGIIAFMKFKRRSADDDTLDMAQPVTEACFYLGALASWKFI